MVKIAYFHRGFLSPLLYRYKLGSILDFRIGILDLRNAVYFKLVERSDSIIPQSLRGVGPYGPEAAI